VRLNDRVLTAAGELLLAELRSLDAIHLVSAQQLGSDLGHLVTYDDRMLHRRTLFVSTTSPPLAR
jgi:predicted nucleic acid-binding protein